MAFRQTVRAQVAVLVLKEDKGVVFKHHARGQPSSLRACGVLRCPVLKEVGGGERGELKGGDAWATHRPDAVKGAHEQDSGKGLLHLQVRPGIRDGTNVV